LSGEVESSEVFNDKLFVMLKNFRTLDLAVNFYRTIQSLPLTGELGDQLTRAALGIVANLGEGTGRGTLPDKRRFFQMAMGSLRECQALLLVTSVEYPEALKLSDQLGGALHRLIERVRR